MGLIEGYLIFHIEGDVAGNTAFHCERSELQTDVNEVQAVQSVFLVNRGTSTSSWTRKTIAICASTIVSVQYSEMSIGVLRLKSQPDTYPFQELI